VVLLLQVFIVLFYAFNETRDNTARFEENHPKTLYPEGARDRKGI
jgi:hypothetical protein